MAKTLRLIIPAYRRNVRKACEALGNRIPQGYHTALAPNGDFIVYSGGSIIGRLPSGNYETFTKG